MFKNLIFILFLSLFVNGDANAQKTESIADINSKGDAFPFGHKMFQGEKICFQAFDRNGNTGLYTLNEKGTVAIHQFSNTDHVILVSQVISAEGKILFSTVNDSLQAGIWLWTGEGKARLIHPDAVLGEAYAARNGKILVNASIPGKSGFIWTLEQGKLQRASAFDKYVDNLAVDRMLIWKDKWLISYRDRFYLYDGATVSLYEPAGKNIALREPFVFKGQLYFSAADSRNNLSLKSVNIADKVLNRGNIVPNAFCMDAFSPLIGDDKAYFLSNPNEEGAAIYSLTETGNPQPIEDKFYQEKDSRFSSYCVNKDGLFFCTKPSHRSDYSIWQYAMDTLIPYQLEGAKNPISVAPWGEDLLMIARHNTYDREPLKLTTFQFPSVKFSEVILMENTPKGRKVGQVVVDKKNSKKLRYDIVGGNPGNAFTIDPYDGSIYVQNPAGLNAKKNPHMDLEVKVITSCFKPVVKVPIDLLVAKPLDMNKLEERFLFYPDFSKKGILLTNVLEDGEHITIFTDDLRMIDDLVVQNKSILFSGYPAGIYIVNAKNQYRNYYQKIEIK